MFISLEIKTGQRKYTGKLVGTVKARRKKIEKPINQK